MRLATEKSTWHQTHKRLPNFRQTRALWRHTRSPRLSGAFLGNFLSQKMTLFRPTASTTLVLFPVFPSVWWLMFPENAKPQLHPPISKRVLFASFKVSAESRRHNLVQGQNGFEVSPYNQSGLHQHTGHSLFGLACSRSAVNIHLPTSSFTSDFFWAEAELSDIAEHGPLFCSTLKNSRHVTSGSSMSLNPGFFKCVFFDKFPSLSQCTPSKTTTDN